MIGIFDSGVGGLSALNEIRALAPRTDIFYLADRENAPYGTKSPPEILRIVKRNLERLRALGAEKILIACCTASTVWHLLSDGEKEISYPIIEPTARAAVRESKSGRIGVISTEATAKSRAFTEAILRLRPDATVFEAAAQEFVSLVEDGACDERCSPAARRKIERRLRIFDGESIDALILGCTHFPHLEKTIGEYARGARTVSCSREGALEMIKICSTAGCGETFYIQ